MYKCDICHKSFSRKYNFDRHINRKFKCKETMINDNKNIVINIVPKNEKDKTKKLVQKMLKNVENLHQIDAENVELVQKTLKNVENLHQIYKCDLCDKKYKAMSALYRHIKYKHTNDNKKIEINKYKCIICNKMYKDRTAFWHHKKKHTNYDEELKKRTDEIELLKNNEIKKNTEIEQLKAELNKQQPTKQILLNSNNKITINNTINFGGEHKIKLTNEERYILLQNPDESIYMLTRLVFCNPKIPENSTVLVTNLRSEYANVKQNNKLIICRKDIILSRIANNISCQLRECASKNCEILPPSKIKSLRNTCDLHAGFNKDNIKKSPDAYEHYNTLLYNDRDVVHTNLTNSNVITEKDDNDDIDSEIEIDKSTNPMYKPIKQSEMKDIYKSITPEMLKEYQEQALQLTPDEMVQYTLKHPM